MWSYHFLRLLKKNTSTSVFQLSWFKIKTGFILVPKASLHKVICRQIVRKQAFPPSHQTCFRILSLRGRVTGLYKVSNGRDTRLLFLVPKLTHGVLSSPDFSWSISSGAITGARSSVRRRHWCIFRSRVLYGGWCIKGSVWEVIPTAPVTYFITSSYWNYTRKT